MMKQVAVIQCTKRSKRVEAHDRAARAAALDPHHAADQIEDAPAAPACRGWRSRRSSAASPGGIRRHSRPAGCSSTPAFWSGMRDAAVMMRHLLQQLLLPSPTLRSD